MLPRHKPMPSYLIMESRICNFHESPPNTIWKCVFHLHVPSITLTCNIGALRLAIPPVMRRPNCVPPLPDCRSRSWWTSTSRQRQLVSKFRIRQTSALLRLPPPQFSAAVLRHVRPGSYDLLPYTLWLLRLTLEDPLQRAPPLSQSQPFQSFAKCLQDFPIETRSYITSSVVKLILRYILHCRPCLSKTVPPCGYT